MRRVHIVVEFDESVCMKVGFSTIRWQTVLIVDLSQAKSSHWQPFNGTPIVGSPYNGVNHLGYMSKYSTKQARSEYPNVSSTSFPSKPYSGNAREPGMICPGQLLDSKSRALFLKCWSGGSAICASLSIIDWSLHHLSISICY